MGMVGKILVKEVNVGMNIRAGAERLDQPQGFVGWPVFKYLGFTFLLAWHYCLWFVPNVFPNTFLLDDIITFSWLIDLGCAAVVLFILPQALGRERHLSNYRAVPWVSVIVAAVGTLLFVFVACELSTPLPAYLLSALLGCASALLWILWGERCALIRARFSIRHVAPTYGICFLLFLGLAYLLPAPFATIFVAILPLLSGLLLRIARNSAPKAQFPLLLPRGAAQQGMRSILTVCLISFVACVACYFLVAIVPWEDLPSTIDSFTLGVALGAVFILLIAVLGMLPSERLNIFKLFNWLLVLTTLAGVLYLASHALGFMTFNIALMVTSVFEVLLTMYFGILTLKGYVSPALAFGLAGGSIRLGIAVGNTWAIIYERLPEIVLQAHLIPATTLFFVMLLIMLLISLVRQEYYIANATSVPQTGSEIETLCGQIASEFCLSCRETDIVVLIARGYNSNAIAKKLVISPFTVNTHIQHIYDKMNIHKRSELFSYINRRGPGD
jgi:DNA-binding CsgD family transcriptional regulator